VNPFDLAGRTALVTGASSGLGRHFAGVLSRAGAAVVLAARRVEALEEAASEIRAAGGTASVVAMDVGDSASIATALDAAGPLDILVNNAGTAAPAAFLSLAEADLDRVLDVNLKGVFLVAQGFARRARDAGRPAVIVNIASVLGLRVAGHVAAYAASKAGVIQLTRAMALELARDRIRVNAIAPGYFATEINGDFLESDAGRAMLKRIPQRRIGDLSDLDGPLLLLCSDASAYMTGAVIPVDGGHLVSSL
jgi:NAD(P)-dependent dehydrogenase (short-subunit alcohol dehydrogenase family)